MTKTMKSLGEAWPNNKGEIRFGGELLDQAQVDVFGINVILVHQNALGTVSKKVFGDLIHARLKCINASEFNTKASGKSEQVGQSLS